MDSGRKTCIQMQSKVSHRKSLISAEKNNSVRQYPLYGVRVLPGAVCFFVLFVVSVDVCLPVSVFDSFW